MSEYEIYDTDGRRVDERTAASEDTQGLIRRLSKSSFADAYYDGRENVLCYRIEGSYTGPHSRGGREQSFYVVVRDPEAIERLDETLSSIFANSDWKPARNYGEIDRTPVEDAHFLANRPHGEQSASNQKEKLIGDLLFDGESGLAVGTPSRESALQLLALYSNTQSVIVVGDEINDGLAEETDLVIEYGHNEDLELLNKATKRRLSRRRSEQQRIIVDETTNQVESNLTTLTQQTSTQTEIEVLQEIKRAIRQNSRSLSDNYPNSAHEIVVSVREACQQLDGKSRRKLLEQIDETIEENIETARSEALNESANRISQTISEEMEALTGVVAGSSSEIKQRLLSRSAPDSIKLSRRRPSTGSVTDRLPIPKLYPPDIAVGVFLTLLLVLPAMLLGLPAQTQTQLPADTALSASSSGHEISVSGSAATENVTLQLTEQGRSGEPLRERTVRTNDDGSYAVTLSDVVDGQYQLVALAGEQRVQTSITVETQVGLEVESPTWGVVIDNASSQENSLRINGTTNGTRVTAAVLNTTTGEIVAERQLNITDSRFSGSFGDVSPGTYQVQIRAFDRVGAPASVTRTVTVRSTSSSSPG